MIHAAYAHPDETEPLDGDELASTLGWSHWSDYVVARHDHYPAAAQLALWHWSDNPADLEHELEQLVHDCDDEDLVAVTAQILSAVKAMPEGATFYLTDGEPASEGGGETAEAIELDPLVFESLSRLFEDEEGGAGDEAGGWFRVRE